MNSECFDWSKESNHLRQRGIRELLAIVNLRVYCVSWNSSTEGSVQWDLWGSRGRRTDRLCCVTCSPPSLVECDCALSDQHQWMKTALNKDDVQQQSVVSLWLNGEMWFQCNNNNIIIRNCVNCCPHLHIVLVRQLKTNTKTLDKCPHWGCEVVSLPVCPWLSI